jgi:ribonuclease BN (tRNA processing enzyme)
MKILIKGCSGGIGEGLHTTSILLNDRVLIDAGTGACTLPLDDMAQIKDIFITHSHLDHVGGIPLLVDTMFDQLDEPMNLHAQEATCQALQTHLFNNTIWPDFARLPTADSPVMQYRVMNPGETRSMDDFDITMIRVNHIVPTVAYRVSTQDGAFAFSGDTTTTDELWQVLNEQPVDFLIVECGFPNREEELADLARHYCPSTLATDLKKLEYRPVVYISHLKPGAEQETFVECRDALPEFELVRLRDGDELSLLPARIRQPGAGVSR